MSVSASAALNVTETSVDTPLTAAQAGTYAGMTIVLGTAVPASNTLTFTLRSNAANTAITCQIPAGGTTCSDTTHSVALVTGNLLAVQVARAGTTGTYNSTYQVVLQKSLASPRIVIGKATSAGNDAPTTINFGGPSSFSSATSYICQVTDWGTSTVTPHYYVNYVSGTTMTVANQSTGASTFGYTCIGN